MTSGTIREAPKEPKQNKTYMINMVKAVTTRSGTRETPTDKETENRNLWNKS